MKIEQSQITTEIWEIWVKYNNGEINYYEMVKEMKKLVTPDKVELIIEKLEG